MTEFGDYNYPGTLRITWWDTTLTFKQNFHYKSEILKHLILKSRIAATDINFY